MVKITQEKFNKVIEKIIKRLNKGIDKENESEFIRGLNSGIKTAISIIQSEIKDINKNNEGETMYRPNPRIRGPENHGLD